MEDALEELTASESISGYKPQDHLAPTNATKTVRLQRLPPLLVLFLMRFDPANLRQKITCVRWGRAGQGVGIWTAVSSVLLSKGW